MWTGLDGTGPDQRGKLVDSLPATTLQPPAFLFATCQVGAERALKSELARTWPAFSFAYSRPGFLTFKLPRDHGLPDDFDLKSVFARAYGFSLGKVSDLSLDERAESVWKLAGNRAFDALHVWQREIAAVGHRGYEPQVAPAACEAENVLRQRWPGCSPSLPAPHARIAVAGQLVLDCILVEPDMWWLGYHRALDGQSCLPGGLVDIALPSEAVSRAYLKMEEALLWSGLPIRKGDRFAEIGCAPGGAAQALLSRGLHVIGIDPAQIDPCVLADPNFTHVQKRGSEVRRREFRGVCWLAADMNVAPEYTLDTLEAIVTHPTVNIRGLIMTLKLPDWNLAEQIPAYLERIRSWGYPDVRAKQLAHNRQEICVTALRGDAKKKPPTSSPRAQRAESKRPKR